MWVLWKSGNIKQKKQVLSVKQTEKFGQTDAIALKAYVIRGYLCIFHYAFYFIKVKNDRLMRERERERERERMISCLFCQEFFYVFCTFDTRLDVIGQHLVQAFSKKEVRPSAPRNGLQSTILLLPVCAQMLSPKSKRRC